MVLMSKREASMQVAEDYVHTTQRILKLTSGTMPRIPIPDRSLSLN